MKNSALTQINLYEIDLSDKTYVFTFEPIMSKMVKSIQNIGIINPPIVAQVSDRPSYRIISGLKRILALLHLKMKTFSAVVYHDEGDKPKLDFFLINFYENISTRELNIIEKSLVLNKLLLTFKLSRDEVLTKYLPLLGLGSNQKVLDLFLPLIRLEDNLKIAVLEDFLSPDLAVQLLNYSSQDRQAIYELFSALKLGKNRQKEFLRLLNDISHMLNKPVTEIIHQPSIQLKLEDEKSTITLKVNQIRDFLRNLRFPTLSLTEEKFNQLKKELKFPPNIIFRSPPFFENDKYSIEIIFRNQKEFDAAMKILTDACERKKFSQLETLIQ